MSFNSDFLFLSHITIRWPVFHRSSSSNKSLLDTQLNNLSLCPNNDSHNWWAPSSKNESWTKCFALFSNLRNVMMVGMNIVKAQTVNQALIFFFLVQILKSNLNLMSVWSGSPIALKLVSVPQPRSLQQYKQHNDGTLSVQVTAPSTRITTTNGI